MNKFNFLVQLRLKCFLISLNLVMLLVLVACAEVKKETKHALKQSVWTSSYATYANCYRFINDSIGTLEAGQVAWSMGGDPANLPKDEHLYCYNEPDTFRFTLKNDSVLQIRFTSPDHARSDRVREYHYSVIDSAWISTHEFVYGKEYLRRGSKLRRMQGVQKIE